MKSPLYSLKNISIIFGVVAAIAIISFNSYNYINGVLDDKEEEEKEQIERVPKVSFSPNIEKANKMDVDSFTGEIVEITDNMIRISTNGRDSYSGVFTGKTIFLEGKTKIQLSEIKEGMIATLFVEKKVEDLFEILSVRIVNNFGGIDNSMPPSAGI